MFWRKRKTAHQAQEPTALPAAAQSAPESFEVPTDWRVDRTTVSFMAFPHPGPLVIADATVTCRQCGAEREWMVIKTSEGVFVRCRCTFTWPEPRISPQWFDDLMGPVTDVAPDFNHALRSMGYDGVFSGTYLVE
ncbi:hypothetical protein [Streptomyces abikoensis]|uniref:hypothetical protein n=1 Tax=Streptomyces abikoensis TaxID=97398 RepID=UPI0016778B4C|nr:hypothetical protein [Streptomyces abikoensis]GGP40663.1 hypothetical protein GCM10010214_12560 [Streptomyces abikoensis]